METTGNVLKVVPCCWNAQPGQGWVGTLVVMGRSRTNCCFRTDLFGERRERNCICDRAVHLAPWFANCYCCFFCSRQLLFLDKLQKTLSEDGNSSLQESLILVHDQFVAVCKIITFFLVTSKLILAGKMYWNSHFTIWHKGRQPFMLNIRNVLFFMFFHPF